jgi:NTE family protein
MARMQLCPDWVTGISIDAINAALIAGNPPERRVERLREFWDQISSLIPPAPVETTGGLRSLMSRFSAAVAVSLGAPGFFHPNVVNPLVALAGSPNAISVYDTRPLRATLERLVDFDLINDGPVRLSVDAVC